MSNDLAAGLAVAGFVLALVSLTWQFWFAHHVDRPRLRVTVDKLKIETPGEMVPTGVTQVEQVIGITVTNAGRRATVVHSLNLVLGTSHRIRDRTRPKRWRPTYDVLPYATGDTSVVGTSLPCRLESGDEASSYASLDRMKRIMDGRADRRVHGVAGSSTAGTGRSPPDHRGVAGPAELIEAWSLYPSHPGPSPAGRPSRLVDRVAAWHVRPAPGFVVPVVVRTGVNWRVPERAAREDADSKVAGRGQIRHCRSFS